MSRIAERLHLQSREAFFKWNYLVKMFYKKVNCITKAWQIVLYHIPNHIVVDVEITVSDMVTHTFNSFPWNLWFGRQ